MLAVWALAASQLPSCGATTFRCDPSLSWSTVPPRDGGEPGPSCADRTCLADVVAGARHTCLFTSRGFAMCFGDHEHGQSSVLAPPAPEIGPSVVAVPATARTHLPALAAGAAMTCALRGPSLRCWGHPALLGMRGAALEGDDIVEVFDPHVAAMHACVGVARVEGGARVVEQHCFGAWDGRDASATPARRPIARPIPPAVVAASGFRTCALAEEGLVCRGGVPPDGVLSDGAWNGAPALVPLTMPLSARVELGPEHGCARVRATREMFCWGRGDRGQLGDGASRSSATPVRVGLGGAGALGRHCVGGEGPLVSRDGVIASSPWPGFACAVIGGAVECWGANDSGQLGDGTREDRAAPVRALLPATASVIALACGGAHVCAATREQLYCWGSNERGQLGVPSSELAETPLPIEIAVPDPQMLLAETVAPAR